MNEEKWLEQVRQTLQHESDNLSPELQDQLLVARRKALDELATPQSRERRVLWPSLAALAAGVVVSFALVLMQSSTPGFNGMEPMAAGDIELLADSENLQMLDELEFYQWLAEEERNAG